MTALRRGDVEAVRLLATEAVEASEALGHHPEVVAGAKGCLAWLAWQDDRPHDVLRLAGEAEQLMSALRRTTGSTQVPTAWYGSLDFNWVFLWPVVALQLQAGNVAEAIDAGRQMLELSQQRFEDELESTLESACEAWDRGDPKAARVTLKKALMLSRGLRYF